MHNAADSEKPLLESQLQISTNLNFQKLSKYTSWVVVSMQSVFFYSFLNFELSDVNEKLFLSVTCGDNRINNPSFSAIYGKKEPFWLHCGAFDSWGFCILQNAFQIAIVFGSLLIALHVKLNVTLWPLFCK